MTTTLYLTSSATSSPFPTTSRLLNTTPNASEVQLGPGEFDSGLPGTTDSGQWNPNSAIGDTTAAAEIDNTGASPGTGRQGWLWDQSLTGRKLKSGAWSVQLRLRANQGTGTLGRILARVSIVHGNAGAYVTDQNILTTAITGEGSHSTGQNGWRANEGSRITVTSTAADFAVTIESGVTAGSRTFASGERILVELGFGDGDSTTDRTWRLDYNQSNSFITVPDIVDPITGTANGAATTSATLAAKGALAGSSAGAGSAAANLVGRGALAGAIAGTSTVAGEITGEVGGAIDGSSSGIATAAASIAGRTALVGAVAGSGTAAASIVGRGLLTSSSAGVATASATIAGDGALAGASAGAATAAATLGAKGALSGTVVAAASVGATIAGRSALTATSIGLASSAAILLGRGALTGTSAGSSTAAIAAPGAIAGAAAGSSSVSAVLLAVGALAGTSAGAATALAMMFAIGRLIGSSAGTSTATAAFPVPSEQLAVLVNGTGARHAPIGGRRRPAGVTKIGRED